MRPPDRPVDPIERALSGWLPRQRWFAGKGREIDGVQVVAGTDLTRDEPELRHMIVSVDQDGRADHYQLLLGGRRELPERLWYAEISHPAAADGELHVYDAVHDPELTRLLLRHMADESTVGPLRFRRARGVTIDTDLASLPSPAEQSNTSLVFGDSYICKVFRRITPGVNPDLELNLGLSEAGCPYVPRLYGWIETDLGGRPTTLAMMSQFLTSATDGWQLATTSVRDFYATAEGPAGDAGGDFAAEAERLGAATAAVHRDLAAAFGVTELPAGALRAAAARMHDLFDETAAEVPELGRHAGRIRPAFDALAGHGAPVPVQRIHGDYHLGQVIRTDQGWMLLDFEGEPAREAAERRAPSHPLRDVAGMLRSFEYAARYLIADRQDERNPELGELLEARAREWADRNRSAFCRGYAAAGGPDPAAHPTLMRAFELDKAVYEVLYEVRNRPSWLPVPLGSLARPVRGAGAGP